MKLQNSISGNDITTTWDQRGNLVHDGVFTYTYNAAGRLVQAGAVGVGFKPTPTARGTIR